MQEAHCKEPASLRGLALLDRVTLIPRAAGKQLQCPPLAPLPPPPSQSLLLHLMVTPQPAAIAFHATSEAATEPPAVATLQAYSISAERGPEDPCALVSAGRTRVVIVFPHHVPALQSGFCRHPLTSSPGLPLT